MKARSLRYHILLWSLIILIVFYIGMTFLFPAPSNASNNGITDDPASGMTDPVLPPEGDEPDEDNQKEIPVDPIELINYALDIYNNGKGSASTFKQTVSVKLSFGELSGSGQQYATGNIYRCGKQNMEETTYSYGKLDPSWIENMALQYNVLKVGSRSINVDENANKVYFVEKDRFGKVSTSTYNVKDAVDKFKIIYSMEFPLEISSKTVSIKKYDNRTSKSYNYITVSYNLNKLSENALNYLHANSAYRNVTYTGYEYTFVISKKTGKMARLIREETFHSHGNGAASALQLSSKSVFQQDFQVMDGEVEVKKPYLEYIKK